MRNAIRPPSDDLALRFADIERRFRALETRAPGGISSGPDVSYLRDRDFRVIGGTISVEDSGDIVVSGGSIHVEDNGDVVVSDGGNVQVGDDGDVVVDGGQIVVNADGDGAVVISRDAAGPNRFGVAWRDGADGSGAHRASISTDLQFGGEANTTLQIRAGESGGQQSRIILHPELMSLVADLTEAIRLVSGADQVQIRVGGNLKPVTQGAADSAGAGFRVLRVPN